MPEACDLVVVGAGIGGYTAALEAARRGRSVLLVDRAGRDGVGGVCLLEGCIPSKALIELATAFDDHHRRGVMGLESAAPRLDLRRFQEWKSSVVRSLGDGVRGQLESAGVEVVAAMAAFTGPRSLRLQAADRASALVEFDHALIATGSTTVDLDGVDARDPRVLDAAGVLDLTELPSSVIVVGGGYVGVELGTALRKLGASVVLVEAADVLVPGLDPWLGREVVAGMRRLGCDVRLGTTVLGLTEEGLDCRTGDAVSTIVADAVVVAVGRRPATEGLELQRAGVGIAATGHIEVDASRMAAARIAAIGDVVAGPGLAHKAAAEALVAVDSLCGEAASFERLVPAVVFSDPEVASVGLSSAQAIEAGYAAREAMLPTRSIGRPLISQSTHGGVRLVYDRVSGLLLGGSLCGPHATELIAEIGLAVEAGLQVGDVAGTIHPHPTVAELVGQTALRADLEQGAHHVPV
jgi:dihydrolipoamide dehydrogenase